MGDETADVFHSVNACQNEKICGRSVWEALDGQSSRVYLDGKKQEVTVPGLMLSIFLKMVGCDGVCQSPMSIAS